MKNGSVCHRMLTCSYYNNGIVHPCKSLEHFNMTSSSSYWCSETINRWSCWCSEPILWGLNIFLVWKRSFVAINLHRCWPQRKEALNRFLRIREFSLFETRDPRFPLVEARDPGFPLFEARELGFPGISLTVPWLAQLGERWPAERKIAGSNRDYGILGLKNPFRDSLRML